MLSTIFLPPTPPRALPVICSWAKSARWVKPGYCLTAWATKARDRLMAQDLLTRLPLRLQACSVLLGITPPALPSQLDGWQEGHRNTLVDSFAAGEHPSSSSPGPPRMLSACWPGLGMGFASRRKEVWRAAWLSDTGRLPPAQL